MYLCVYTVFELNKEKNGCSSVVALTKIIFFYNYSTQVYLIVCVVFERISFVQYDYVCYHGSFSNIFLQNYIKSSCCSV